MFAGGDAGLELMGGGEGGGWGGMAELWPGWGSPFQWGLIVYSALVPEALATSLQGRGQSVLPASQGGMFPQCALNVP
jgi:hypothetical protein